MRIQTVGFVGLGIMGRPMALNLRKAGYRLVVHDMSRAAMESLTEAGASAAGDAAEVARASDVVITMLPNSPDVRQVVLGERGVLDGARPGLLLIDTSSIAPGVARELSQAAAERGVRMLDAPVSGGEPKAKDGTLSFMVGGACADFEEARELLAAMGKNIAWIGEAGSGQVAKLANQIIVGLNIIGAAEAMVLAAKAGVSPRSVYQAIRGGLAGSTVLDAKAPMMFDRNFAPGFRIELHLKDLLNALDTAHQCGAPAPFTSLAAETMNAVKAAGKGKLDHAALVHFFESLAGVEVG